MIKAEELGLDVNHGEIVYFGAIVPGQSIPSQLEENHLVVLKKGDDEIEVSLLKKDSNGNYSGIVRKVDFNVEFEDNGVANGVAIEFSHDHIFACCHS